MMIIKYILSYEMQFYKYSINGDLIIPFLMKFIGKLIMKKAVMDNTRVPISSRRNPNHSLAA